MLLILGWLIKLRDAIFAIMAFLFKPRNMLLPLIVPLVILLAGAWKIHSLTNERDAARNELAEYQEQVRIATEQRKLDNARKETEFQTIMRVEVDYHKAELDKLRGLYNAAKDKSTALANTNNDLRKRLRDEIEAAAAIRLSGGFNRPVGFTEGGGNCDTTDSGYGLEAYTSTLELAAATTTSDYNTLYQRCSAVNRVFGR